MKKEDIKSRWVSGVLIFLGIMAGITLFVMKSYSYDEKFLPGVLIGGIPVEGTTVVEASNLLSRELEQVYSQPIIFYYDNYEEKSELNALCRPVDIYKLVQNVWNQEKEKKWYEVVSNLAGGRSNVYPIELEYIPEALTNLEQNWNQNWGSDFRDAQLEVDVAKGLVVRPGVPGMKVNAGKTFASLPKEIGSQPNQMRLAIVIEKAYPQIDEETLSNMGELAVYTTSFKTWEINRSHNLNTAASRLNGAVIKPQEIFSFNQHVGMRTTEKGYRDAMVIVGGKFEPGLGGGVCQVSSTLYNACLLAGMEIVERSNHNLAVTYVPLGQDATVVYGALDFKFKNNTGYPVYIRAVTYGGQLTINIYGDLAYKHNIKVSHIVDQVIPFTETTELDPTLAVGTEKIDHNGNAGYVVRSFRNYYDQSGKLVKSEMLAKDKYMPLNKLILQGPPAVETTPENGNQNPEDLPGPEGYPANPPEDIQEPPADQPGGNADPATQVPDVPDLDNNYIPTL